MCLFAEIFGFDTFGFLLVCGIVGLFVWSHFEEKRKTRRLAELEEHTRLKANQKPQQ